MADGQNPTPDVASGTQQGVAQGLSPDPAVLAQLLASMRGGQQPVQQSSPISGDLQPPPSMQPQGAPQQSQGALPASSPFDLAAIVKQVAGLPEYQAASGRLDQIGQQEQGIQQQMSGMQMPKMGWSPNMVHGEGVGGFFHNLGQALLAVGAATRPGQAIEHAVYQPGINTYNTKQKNLAEQLSALKDQEAIPTEELRATTGLTQAAGNAAYRQGMLGLGAEKNAIAANRVEAYKQSISDRAQNFAATQDWHSASLDEKKRSNLVNEAQRQADEAGRDFRSLHKDATTEEVAQIVTGTKQQIANEAAAKDPSVKAWLFNSLGLGLPQIQGAPSPEQRPIAQPTPAKPTPKAAAGATPKRPAGVPADAQYDKQTKTWYK